MGEGPRLGSGRVFFAFSVVPGLPGGKEGSSEHLQRIPESEHSQGAEKPPVGSTVDDRMPGHRTESQPLSPFMSTLLKGVHHF